MRGLLAKHLFSLRCTRNLFNVLYEKLKKNDYESYFGLSKPHNLSENEFPNIFLKFILYFSLSDDGKKIDQENSKAMLAFNQWRYNNNKKYLDKVVSPNLDIYAYGCIFFIWNWR